MHYMGLDLGQQRDLMAGLQVRLEQGELKIAKDIPEVDALSVRRPAKGEGKDSFGADGYGQQDDLVMAVALAVWKASARKAVSFGEGRLPGIS